MKKKSNNVQKIKRFLSVFLTTFLFFSCSGDNGSNSGGGESIVKPTNLIISAIPVGVTTSSPNGDGSGTVNFTFSAANATSYKIALGDGVTQESTSGSLSYTYNAAGTNSYTVYVSAYNGSQFISTSVSVIIYVAPRAIWADEFNVDGVPDGTKWGYDLGTGDWGWGNNEAQY
jgi:PKD repeat protein